MLDSQCLFYRVMQVNRVHQALKELKDFLYVLCTDLTCSAGVLLRASAGLICVIAILEEGDRTGVGKRKTKMPSYRL